MYCYLGALCCDLIKQNWCSVSKDFFVRWSISLFAIILSKIFPKPGRKEGWVQVTCNWDIRTMKCLSPFLCIGTISATCSCFGNSRPSWNDWFIIIIIICFTCWEISFLHLFIIFIWIVSYPGDVTFMLWMTFSTSSFDVVWMKNEKSTWVG